MRKTNNGGGSLAFAVLVLVSCNGGQGGEDGGAGDTESGGDAGKLAFGAPCSEHRQCVSGLCLGSGICSRTCTAESDCPGLGWTCDVIPGLGKRCFCGPHKAEVCNGRDDDCDGTVDDGVLCPSGERCTQGRCQCVSPAIRCHGSCVDVTKSAQHCGRCDNACPSVGAPPHMEPACRNGKCGWGCKKNRGDCDGSTTNGCETDINSAKLHCGKCNSACKNVCAGGACCDHPQVVKQCSGGWCTIPAGCFLIGSPKTEPCRDKYDQWKTILGPDVEQQHPVRLSRSFEIASTEVTQAQYKTLMGINPSLYYTSTNPKCDEVPGASPACYCGSTETCDNVPVNYVTWNMAANYCNALSKRRGVASCYGCTGSGRSVTCTEATGYNGSGIYRCPGYRLPTEAEWEYAYRAGTTTAYYSGSNDPDPKVCGGSDACDKNLSKIALYGCNTKLGSSRVVAQKLPNGWGLYDMAGGHIEWCNDWLARYSVPAGGTASVDPAGPAYPTLGKYRVTRSWYGGAPYYHRAANRRAGEHDDSGGMHGFRCVRTLKP